MSPGEVLLPLAVGLIVAVFHVILEKEYRGWAYALARWLVGMASSISPRHRDSWTAGLLFVQREEGESGLFRAIDCLISAPILGWRSARAGLKIRLFRAGARLLGGLLNLFVEASPPIHKIADKLSRPSDPPSIRPTPPLSLHHRLPGLGLPALVAIAPLPVLYLILSVPALNPRLVLPSQHLWLAIALSAVALALAGLLVVATVQIGLYRVLLLALGFMTMGILFSVQAISGSILGAYLSLFLPAVLILASYLPATAQLEFRVPFWPGSWLVVVVIATLLSFSALTLAGSDALATLESDLGPLVHLLAAATGVLLAVSGACQARSYLSSCLSNQATLALTFALLAEAQLVMVAAQPWTLAWWAYHLLILGALMAALLSLADRLQPGSRSDPWRLLRSG